jgi:hypothetical protein
METTMTIEKVVPIGKVNLNDIPACLRNLANKIERGETPQFRQAVMVADDPTGEITVWAWGECPNRQQAVGLLHYGIQHILYCDEVGTPTAPVA